MLFQNHHDNCWFYKLTPVKETVYVADFKPRVQLKEGQFAGPL